jgi:hypothetical protein
VELQSEKRVDQKHRTSAVQLGKFTLRAVGGAGIIIMLQYIRVFLRSLLHFNCEDVWCATGSERNGDGEMMKYRRHAGCV